MIAKYYLEIPKEFPWTVEINCSTSASRLKDFKITENGKLLILVSQADVFTSKEVIHQLVINRGENVDKFRHLGKIEINQQTLSVWLENIQ